MKQLFDITMAAARRPSMKIVRPYPLTFRQKCLMRIAYVCLLLCSFSAPQSRQTRDQLLQRLEGFYVKGH